MQRQGPSYGFSALLLLLLSFTSFASVAGMTWQGTQRGTQECDEYLELGQVLHVELPQAPLEHEHHQGPKCGRLRGQPYQQQRLRKPTKVL